MSESWWRRKVERSARVVGLEGPRRAWEVTGDAGHRVLDGRLHLVERAGGGFRRRTFDPFGREVWRRWWRDAAPRPSRGRYRFGALPLCSGAIVIAEGFTPPRVRIGDPDGGWRTVALPVATERIEALIPLRDGGVLVAGESDACAFTLPIGPDGAIGPLQRTWAVNALTARIEVGWGSIDVHDFDNPWEPGWDVVVRPRRGVRRRAGMLGLDAVGTLLHDGWLFVQDRGGALYAVHAGELRLRDALAFGPITRSLAALAGAALAIAIPSALWFVGLGCSVALAPGAAGARRRLRATVPGPFDGWRIIPGTTWSVRPFEDEPRAVRWTRLDDAGHGLWLFDGPGVPRKGAKLVIDPTGEVRVSGWAKHLMAGSPDLYSVPAAARMGDPRRPRRPEDTPCASEAARSPSPSPPPCSRASA